MFKRRGADGGVAIWRRGRMRKQNIDHQHVPPMLWGFEKSNCCRNKPPHSGQVIELLRGKQVVPQRSLLMILRILRK